MNRLLALLWVGAAGVALAQQPPASQVTIVKYEVVPNAGNGEYSFSYELSDGTARSEQGVLQNAGTPDEFLLVMGSFRWTAPDGQVTQVDYTADQDGYHPKEQQQGLGGGGGGLSGALAASLVG